MKNELLTLWQSSVDLDVEVGLLSTLWKIICCHWSTPARVLSSKQALLCKKLTTLWISTKCFHHSCLFALERVNSECAKVAVIFEGLEVGASFVYSFILIGKTNISRSGQLKYIFPAQIKTPLFKGSLPPLQFRATAA